MFEVIRKPPCPKVLLLVHENLYGGGSRQSFYILEALSHRSVPAVLVSNAKESWLGRQVNDSGLPVKTYYTSWIQRAINPFKEVAAFFYILWVILKEKPSAILASGVKLSGLGSLAGWLCRVPQRIVIVRGQGAPEDTRRLSIIYGMERFLSLLGTRYITVCEYNRQEMLAKAVCSPQQIVTVHNGTDIAWFAQGTRGPFRNQLGIPENAFIIGMVGRLVLRQKRFDLFVEMMQQLCRRHENVYGLLVGDGEDKENLLAAIKETGFSDRIRITGYIRDMPPVYADLDISVLFTHYEGCSNILLESCAAAVPIITDDVCGNAEVVRHEVNGFVVPPGAVAQAVSYADQLISDAQQRRDMGLHGRRIAEQHFNGSIQTQKLVDIVSQWPSDTAPE